MTTPSRDPLALVRAMAKDAARLVEKAGRVRGSSAFRRTIHGHWTVISKSYPELYDYKREFLEAAEAGS